jgi:hypothetical protein
MFIHRQMSQKGADSCSIQITRMTLGVKKDEALDPVAIRLFGAQTQMSKACNITDWVEQLSSAMVAAYHQTCSNMVDS